MMFEVRPEIMRMSNCQQKKSDPSSDNSGDKNPCGEREFGVFEQLKKKKSQLTECFFYFRTKIILRNSV